jgi:hypothetical protein
MQSKIEYARGDATITLGVSDLGVWGALTGLTSAFGALAKS